MLVKVIDSLISETGPLLKYITEGGPLKNQRNQSICTPEPSKQSPTTPVEPRAILHHWILYALPPHPLAAHPHPRPRQNKSRGQNSLINHLRPPPHPTPDPHPPIHPPRIPRIPRLEPHKQPEAIRARIHPPRALRVRKRLQHVPRPGAEAARAREDRRRRGVRGQQEVLC